MAAQRHRCTGWHRRWGAACPLLAAALATAPGRVSAEPPPGAAYRVTATVAAARRQIDGAVEIALTNPSARPLTGIVVLLFPNRFAHPNGEADDFTRPYLYPRQEFDPGSIELLEIRDGARPVSAEPFHLANGCPTCAVRVPIAPLAAGATRTIRMRFRTTVPRRFGTFGVFDDQWTLVGGWYPYLAAVDADGQWRADAAPPLADFAVHLTFAQTVDVLLNGRWFPRVRTLAASVPAIHYLTLLMAPHFIETETSAGGTRIRFFHRPERFSSRISFQPSRVETMLDTLRSIVRHRPAGVPAPPETLTVVDAPLRLNLTAPGEGAVIVSDRALRVHTELRPFHEMQLAQAVYAEWLRPVQAAREPSIDYPWVNEGLAYVLARRFLTQVRPATRSVQDWIDLFDIFAIVDRFEQAPKIPFVNAFFEHATEADPLHEQVTTFNNDLPPGRVVIGKLRQELGQPEFEVVFDACTSATTPFRRCAEDVSGKDLGWFFDQWVQPFPKLNYRLGAMCLNQPAGEQFRSVLTVQQDTSRPIREPVELELRSIGGRDVRVRLDDTELGGPVTVETPHRVQQVVIDPDRELIETTRADNAWPPQPQIVLDTAEVEVSSTEFGFSGLVVARGRYDYRKDVAAAGFYTNRSIGVAVGPRYHWGRAIDPTLYRHNVYAFYGVQALDRSFKDKRDPSTRTTGHSNSLGIRYDYNDIYAYDNPTDSNHLRLFADWYDQALGSHYNYADWGADLVLTRPVCTHRTILAGEVLSGFSEPFGASRVPNQGLYSLGGSRSIRGIGAEEELGRNIFLLRGELRQSIYPELDLNFFDLLVLRRTQARVFVDTGQVGNSAGGVYDPAGYAVGVGIGLGAVYEFMGFFPSVAYLEIATRVDRGSDVSDVQVLFGTRQAF